MTSAVILAVFDAMSLVFIVILEVFEVTLVFNEAISVVFAVMLEVLALTLFVNTNSAA